MSTFDESLIIKSTLPDAKYPEDQTLQDYVFNKAKQYGDLPAFIDFDSKFTLTFNQVIGMSDIFSQNLWIQNKFQKGDTIASFSLFFFQLTPQSCKSPTLCNCSLWYS
jgi:hypothetical protein